MIKEIFPGMSPLFLESVCNKCWCYCTAGDPTKDDTGEDDRGEEVV